MSDAWVGLQMLPSLLLPELSEQNVNIYDLRAERQFKTRFKDGTIKQDVPERRDRPAGSFHMQQLCSCT